MVDSFLESLDHPLKPVVESLRLAVLEADDEITERIKWSGLLEMIGQDRGQVIFPSAEVATARQEEFVGLVREWVRA